MKFCSNCGNKLQIDSNFCSKCGNKINTVNEADCFSREHKDNVRTQKNTSTSNETSATTVICGIVGILFPLIGAILYYVFKNSDIKAAKTANTCAWIGFALRILGILFYGTSIMTLIYGL